MLGAPVEFAVAALPPRAERAAFRTGPGAPTPPSVLGVLEPMLVDVRKPAQYVGGEHNMVTKPWGSVDTRWLLCYPDTYEVGQPNQGIQILYEILNGRATTLAERAYAPWIDLEERMRELGVPTFSLEHHHPLWAFDVFAVTLPHELGHTNLLNLLDLGGVPHRSSARDDHDPIVLVGGHAAFNPEPLAPFRQLPTFSALLIPPPPPSPCPQLVLIRICSVRLPNFAGSATCSASAKTPA